MNNNWKRHFDIDSDPSSDQVFTLLDTVQSDNEDEIDQLMNNFDTEFIAPAEIELTDNQCIDTRSKCPCCWPRDHTRDN